MFSDEQCQHKPYSIICRVLREECMAADQLLAEQAKDEYGDEFDSVFEYRRGGEHVVRNSMQMQSITTVCIAQKIDRLCFMLIHLT